MASACLPAPAPLRAVAEELPPGDLLLDALTRFARMSGTDAPAVVLQVNDGEVIGDIGLTGPQAAALAKAVDSLTPPRPLRRRQTRPGQ
jgi:hypothetical protein